MVSSSTGTFRALLLANARYWGTVASLVREQLARWELFAQAIPDPLLRGFAQSKLSEERFNVEAAATFATLAPRPYRPHATEAIVALQVLYDYLDLLTEQPLADPTAAGEFLYVAFTDAVNHGQPGAADYYHRYPQSRDGGYLRELASTVGRALGRLPSAEAVLTVAQHSARRCAQAQILGHAAGHTGRTAELEQWARSEALGTQLLWPELLAGATASVLTVHALIAAAADPHTKPADAERIATAYLPICALTMLDSLSDRAQDHATGQLSYIQCYENEELMGTRLAAVARIAMDEANALPNSPHHVVTLLGIVAYYSSGPDHASAQTVTRPVCRELRPLIAPTLAVMRVWRLAKRVRKGPAIAPDPPTPVRCATK